jgi:hypothetical protein
MLALYGIFRQFRFNVINLTIGAVFVGAASSRD